MKLRFFRMIALVLAVAALLSGVSALASSNGDVLKKSAKAYLDYDLDHGLKYELGTIPANTAVVVEHYIITPSGSLNAKVKYKGVTCYIKASSLLKDRFKVKATGKLPKGVYVFQRPSFSSASKKLSSATKVYYLGKKGNWALFRTTGDDGYYGFVYVG